MSYNTQQHMIRCAVIWTAEELESGEKEAVVFTVPYNIHMEELIITTLNIEWGEGI